MEHASIYGSLYEASLSLESAAALFQQHQWSDPGPGPALGRHVRPARQDEILYLNKSSKPTAIAGDPAEATMHELLAVLKHERPDMALDLTERWERANLEFQALYDQCPEPNEQFVEISLKNRLAEYAMEFETEIELLKEQVTFLDESLSRNAADTDDDHGLQQELDSVLKAIESETGSMRGKELSELKEENSRIECEIRNATERLPNVENRELDDLLAQLEEAKLRLSEVENSNNPKHQHIEAIRNALRYVIRERCENQEPFAIALSALHDHSGVMTVDEFKSNVGDKLVKRSEAISLLYNLIGQGLIEIDRTAGNGVVKSCVNLI